MPSITEGSESTDDTSGCDSPAHKVRRLMPMQPPYPPPAALMQPRYQLPTAPVPVPAAAAPPQVAQALMHRGGPRPQEKKMPRRRPPLPLPPPEGTPEQEEEPEPDPAQDNADFVLSLSMEQLDIAVVSVMIVLDDIPVERWPPEVVDLIERYPTEP